MNSPAVPKDPRSFFKRILDLDGSPHSIAGGLAVGMFFGISPLWGLKTLLTLGVSTAFRFNPIAAVLSLSLHDLLTPFVPIVLRFQYDLGYWILSHPHHLPPKLHVTKIHPEQMLHWTTFVSDGLPLLVGSMVVAIPCTLATYFLSKPLLERRARNKTKEDSQKTS